MHPTNQNSYFPRGQENKNIHHEKIAKNQTKFKHSDTKNPREVSISNSANNVITNNNKIIDEYKVKEKKVENELTEVKIQKHTVINALNTLAQKHEAGGKIDENRYNDLVSELEDLKAKELSLINKRFNIRKSIRQLEEEIQTAGGKLPQAKKIEFTKYVKVQDYVKLQEEGQEQIHYKQRYQALDQPYTERTKSGPKVKLTPHDLVASGIKNLIKQLGKQNSKLEASDYVEIRLIMKDAINQMEYAKNPIQKDRFMSELDLQLSELAKNQGLII